MRGIHVRIRSEYLFDAVEKRIGNVPPHAIVNGKSPWEAWLVQIHEQADEKISQLNLLKMKAGTGCVEKGRQARQQQG
jgi:hypothetical protein